MGGRPEDRSKGSDLETNPVRVEVFTERTRKYMEG